MLMLALIILQIGTHIFVVIAINIHADNETRCISYKEVLPNGVCINELKNYNIFQSPFRAKFINEGKQLEKIFLSYVKDKTREQVLLYLNRAIRAFFNRFPDCSDNPSFRKLFKDLERTVATNISLRCINSFRRVFCHTMHPVCFKSKEDGRIILSSLCERFHIESGCKGYMYTWVYNLHLNAYKSCRNHLPDPRKDTDIYLAVRFLMADMKHIERCQNIVETKENHFQGSCYIDDGTFYHGTVDITTTGKTCLPWSINPFLSSPVYGNLKYNYCRNPQAYAAAPWCYVNASTRDWEYCDVPKCGESNKADNKNVNSTLIEIAAVIVVSVLVFTFVLVVLMRKIYSVWRKKKNGDEYIEPYYVFDASSEEKKSQLLRLLISED